MPLIARLAQLTECFLIRWQKLDARKVLKVDMRILAAQSKPLLD